MISSIHRPFQASPPPEVQTENSTGQIDSSIVQKELSALQKELLAVRKEICAVRREICSAKKEDHSAERLAANHMQDSPQRDSTDRKRKYMKWSNNSLDQAITAVEEGMNQSVVTKQFTIPSSTLSGCVDGRSERIKPSWVKSIPVKIKNQTLSPEEGEPADKLAAMGTDVEEAGETESPSTQATSIQVLKGGSNGRVKGPKYTVENLAKAVQAVKEKSLSQAAACRQLGIPRSTLSGYIMNRSIVGCKPGRKCSIPKAIEDDLVSKAITAAEAGFPLTKGDFLLRVATVVKEENLDTPFKDGMPGDKYWRELKNRYPDLIQKAKIVTGSYRKNSKASGDVVSRYFDQLEKLLTELDLLLNPAAIWNADEVGMQFCAEPVRILTKRAAQDTTCKDWINREMNMAMLCANALGQTMPPLFLADKEEGRTLQKYSLQTTVHGTAWIIHENPWDSDQIMMIWFNEVFLKNCGPFRPQVLILNNYGSIELPELLEAAKKENIHIMALPPRTSSILEPLHKGVFMSLQKAFRLSAAQFFIENPTLHINASTWPNIMCDVWSKVMTAEAIMKAFEVTGIYPLDRSKVSRTALTSTNKSGLVSVSHKDIESEQFQLHTTLASPFELPTTVTTVSKMEM